MTYHILGTKQNTCWH